MRAKEFITEQPYLNKIELPYKAITRISRNRLDLSYTEIGAIDDFIVYQNNDSKSIVSGKYLVDEFYTATMLVVRKLAYPVEPTQLTNIMQVSMVTVSEGFDRMGLTTKLYNLVSQVVDLVSDEEQYLGAQGLWKSVARDTDSNVYVFDGNLNDYRRDSSGTIIKYNGQNIDNQLIWGQTDGHRMILLVATTKELT